MATVFLDGRFVEGDEARVSAFDAGLQHGVGVFETMVGGVRDARGWVHRLDDHLDRLLGSAAGLGLAGSLARSALADAVVTTVERAGLGRARIRLTVTGGDARRGAGRIGTPARGTGDEGGDGRGPAGVAARADPTILVVAEPAPEYPDRLFDAGASAVLAGLRVNPLDPLAGHKTLGYWGRLRELAAAAGRGAAEAIVFQVTNHLAGGCVSNVFLVKGGRLLTPIARGEEGGGSGSGLREPGGAYLPSPVLPGVTRRAVIGRATETGVECDRRMLTIDDLLGADEVFLTNSLWGVLPIVRVEGSVIGGGGVGPLTRDLRRAWLEEQETLGGAN